MMISCKTVQIISSAVLQQKCVGLRLRKSCWTLSDVNLIYKKFRKLTVNILTNLLFPMALQSLKDFGSLAYRRFLELFRHTVGLLGRVISPSQGLPTQSNTTQKDADKHPCLERDSNPRSQQPSGQDPRLRPHDHCDRLSARNFHF
jgi:hypothetical protein